MIILTKVNKKPQTSTHEGNTISRYLWILFAHGIALKTAQIYFLNAKHRETLY